jgi:hypothetical protein
MTAHDCEHEWVVADHRPRLHGGTVSCDTCGKAIPTGHEGLIENDGELHPYCGECETPEEFGAQEAQ